MVKAISLYEEVCRDILDTVERFGVIKNVDLPALVSERSLTSGMLLTCLTDLIDEEKLYTVPFVTRYPKVMTRTLIFPRETKLLLKNNG